MIFEIPIRLLRGRNFRASEPQKTDDRRRKADDRDRSLKRQRTEDR